MSSCSSSSSTSLTTPPSSPDTFWGPPPITESGRFKRLNREESSSDLSPLPSPKRLSTLSSQDLEPQLNALFQTIEALNAKITEMQREMTDLKERAVASGAREQQTVVLRGEPYTWQRKIKMIGTEEVLEDTLFEIRGPRWGEKDPIARTVYKGHTKNHLPHGRGEWYYFSGEVYRGNWKNGLKCDSGVLQFLNGTLYEGLWVSHQNNKCELGDLITYFVGDLIQGNDRQKVGLGEFWNPDERVNPDDYSEGIDIGCFELLNGQRKVTFNDERVYDGNWSDGKKHGQGTLTYPVSHFSHRLSLFNALKLEGTWEDDQIIHGTITYQNNNVYVGFIRHEGPDGLGVMTYANGDVYEGRWYERRWLGEGTLTLKNGKTITKEWEIGADTLWNNG